MTVPNETVVAGSRAFALALLAPLTERLGIRPRIAADPARALDRVGGPGDLVVVEFLGEETLRAVEALVRDGPGVRVLAVVPEPHAEAAEPLRALGVEIATCDGTAAGALAAVLARLPPPPAPPTIPAVEPAPAPTPLPPPREPPWPTEVPGEVEAAAALERALDGELPPAGTPLACAAGVLANLSELERDVLLGMLQPFEPDAVRRSAVMRLRVAAALATAPPPGIPDAAAVSALLAEIDALLEEMSALVASAPPDAAASLQAVRNALVGEALAFSDAAQRATAACAPAAPAAAAGAATRSPAPGATRTHVRNVARGRASAPRSAALSIALAVTVAAAAGWHGWRLQRGHAVRAARSAGAPEGMADISAVPGGRRVLVPATTREVTDAAGILRLKTAEQAKGNVVRQTDRIIVVLPGPRAAGAEALRGR